MPFLGPGTASLSDSRSGQKLMYNLKGIHPITETFETLGSYFHMSGIYQIDMTETIAVDILSCIWCVQISVTHRRYDM